MRHLLFLSHPAAVLLIALCQIVDYNREDRLEEANLALQEALQDFKRSHFDRVIYILERSLSEHPNHAGSHHLIGLAYSMKGEKDNALRHLNRSLTLSPGHPTFSVNLARMYLGQGNLDQARQTLEESLKIAPSIPVHHMLGFMFLDEHKGADAFTSFEKAMKLDPRDMRSWYYMGLTHHAYGHFDEAISCYKEALKLMPSDFYSNFQLGKVYALRRMWDEALKHFSAAEGVHKGSPEVYRYLSQAYVALKNFDEGLLAAQRAVELSPADPTAHFQLGRTLVRLGRRNEAREHLRYLDNQGPKTEPSLSEHWQLVFRGGALSAEKP
jgi:tetratricopeptide (TPR) repeat protein